MTRCAYSLLPLAVAAVFLGAVGAAAQTGPVPIILDGSRGDSVVVPMTLLEAIDSELPEFHLPSGSEIRGPWRLAILNEVGAEPYITWGDFNGDGHFDVAAILLNQARWSLVILHGSATEDFALAWEHLEASDDSNPTHNAVRLVPKGHEVEDGRVFPNDAIEFIELEASTSYVFYENGEYHIVSFLGE